MSFSVARKNILEHRQLFNGRYIFFTENLIFLIQFVFFNLTVLRVSKNNSGFFFNSE